jgi:O-antigen/teichoic acid export membrane protein
VSERLESRAGRAVLWQAGRLAGTKLIFLARMLLLARLLTPEDFGLMAIAVVGVELMLTFTEFGMIPALVQRPAADRREYDLAWTVGVLRALGVAAAVFVAAPAVAEFFAEPRAVPLLRLMAVRPLLEAVASIRVAVLVRELNFRGLAFLQLPDAIVNAVVSVALAPAFGVWALAAGSLAGKATYLVISYVVAPYAPRFALDGPSARPLITFGRWILAVGIVSFVGRSLLQAAISRRAGTAELGLYTLAARLAFLPSEVASDVVGAVAFPLYVQLREDARRVSRAFRVVFTGLLAVVLPATVVLVVLAPSLAADVLGPRWTGTATPIRVLAVAGLVGMLGDAVVPVFHGFGRPQRQFAMELLQSTVLVGMAWWLAGPLGALGASLAWIAAACATQGVGALLVRDLVEGAFSGLFRPLAAIAVASLGGALVAVAVGRVMPGPLGFFTAVALAGVTIVALEWVLDRWLRLGLSDDVLLLFPGVAPLLRPRREAVARRPE